ncbi:hypothetical protein HYY71_00020 [Candidatus Woesearchaeota archaeon]|nr:hypothetical protein [Candidatus Woesearchaeota archaeon]
MGKITLALALLFIIGCAQAKDFGYGLKQLDNLNLKYDTTIETYPKDMQQIDAMLNEFAELKKLQLEAGQQPFTSLIDYRVLNLEAEKLYMQGQKYGAAGTTKYGFGCKLRPLITESVSLRNSSALKGFEAVGLLREFITKYPEEAKATKLSGKNALFLNATFYEISKDAARDSGKINRFCPANVTLEIYKQGFLKKSFRERNNLSEEFVNKLSYEEAVKIWKKDSGIE